MTVEEKKVRLLQHLGLGELAMLRTQHTPSGSPVSKSWLVHSPWLDALTWSMIGYIRSATSYSSSTRILIKAQC